MDVPTFCGVEGPQTCSGTRPQESLWIQIFFFLIGRNPKPTEGGGVLTLCFVPVGLWVVWGAEGGVWLPEVKGSSTVSWTNQSRELHPNTFLHDVMWWL